MNWKDELLKLLFERSADQMDANPVERFRRQARRREGNDTAKASKRGFRKFRVKVTTQAGKTASDVHPQTGKIPESNNNWKDKLTSLMLGEQGRKKPTNDNPLGLSDFQVDLHKMVRHSRQSMSQKSAEGAQGNTSRARQKPYLPKYGGGENVAHNIPQTTSQFRKSMKPASATIVKAKPKKP